MSKKKVIHYISTLKNGGAQTQVILLCNNIDLERFDVSIICWNKESAITLRDEIKIVEISRGNKYSLFKFFAGIIKETKKIRPDIIHLWLPEILTFPAALYGWVSNIPVINSERRIPTSNVDTIWFRDRVEYLIHLFSRKITTNFPIPIKKKSIFNTLVYKSGKGATIFNGLDIENLKLLRKKERNIFHDREFRLIYCGRLVKQKNIDLLLRAFKNLISENYKLSLTLIGVGEEEDSLKRFVSESKLESCVSFLGYQNDWKNIAINMDCFILPTSREGMPNVLFEAAAIGLPVIATNIEEISCHFTNGYDSILVPPNDVDSISTAIKIAISDPSHLAKIQKAADVTIGNYTIEKMTNNYENLYQSLI